MGLTIFFFLRVIIFTSEFTALMADLRFTVKTVNFYVYSFDCLANLM